MRKVSVLSVSREKQVTFTFISMRSAWEFVDNSIDKSQYYFLISRATIIRHLNTDKWFMMASSLDKVSFFHRSFLMKYE